MTTAAAMVAEASTRVTTLAPARLEAHLLDGHTRLVDIREPEELDEHGLIAGAFHVPRGLLEFWADPASPSHRPQLDPARHTVVYCAAGSRSALAAVTLQDLGYTSVAHLDGGIVAWKRAGLPVVGLKSWHAAIHPQTSHEDDERSTR